MDGIGRYEAENIARTEAQHEAALVRRDLGRELDELRETVRALTRELDDTTWTARRARKMAGG